MQIDRKRTSPVLMFFVFLIHMACGIVSSPGTQADPTKVCAVGKDAIPVNGYPILNFNPLQKETFVRDQDVRVLNFSSESFFDRPECAPVHLKGLQVKFESDLSAVLFSLQQEGKIIVEGLARQNAQGEVVGEIWFDVPLDRKKDLFLAMNTGGFKIEGQKLKPSIAGVTWQVGDKPEFWSRSENLGGQELVYKVEPLFFKCEDGYMAECKWTRWRNSSGNDLRDCSAPTNVRPKLKCDFSRCLSAYEHLSWVDLPSNFSENYYTSLMRCNRIEYVVFNLKP